MIGDCPKVLNFNWLFLQTRPVHMQLVVGSPRSLLQVYTWLRVGPRPKQLHDRAILLDESKILDPRSLHEGPGPRYDKTKRHWCGTTFLLNLDSLSLKDVVKPRASIQQMLTILGVSWAFRNRETILWVDTQLSVLEKLDVDYLTVHVPCCSIFAKCVLSYSWLQDITQLPGCVL